MSESEEKVESMADAMKRANKMADDTAQAIREVEAQSRSELVERAVLATARDIVKGVIERNAESINENAMKWMRDLIREEFEKMGMVGIIHEEAHKFIREKSEELGTPFLRALEAKELEVEKPKEK